MSLSTISITSLYFPRKACQVQTSEPLFRLLRNHFHCINQTMQLIYSALVIIIGTVAIAILVFTFVMTGTCGNSRWSPLRRPPSHVTETGSSAQLNLSPYLASSFRFRKEAENEEAKGTEGLTGCVVCLLGLEDDEEIRQLHRCKHSFHAPCIDMWMYSHSICPIFRTPVDRRAPLDFTSDDNSSSVEVLTDKSVSHHLN